MDPTVIVLAALLGVAAMIDLRSRRIPNLLVGLGLCFGFGLAYSSMGQAGLWFALKGVAAGLAMFFPLFALRALGAGDVKLMMAVGSLVGAQDSLIIALIALLASGLFALAGSAYGGRLSRMFADLKATVFALSSGNLDRASILAEQTAWRVPFAVPLLVAALVWLSYFY